MPIQRFGAILIANGEFDRYLDLLQRASRYQSRARHVQKSDLRRLARLHLRLRLQSDARSATQTRRTRALHLSELLDAKMEGRPGHCYGCTAG
jgi:hypothetical protein